MVDVAEGRGPSLVQAIPAQSSASICGGDKKLAFERQLNKNKLMHATS